MKFKVRYRDTSKSDPVGDDEAITRDIRRTLGSENFDIRKIDETIEETTVLVDTGGMYLDDGLGDYLDSLPNWERSDSLSMIEWMMPEDGEEGEGDAIADLFKTNEELAEREQGGKEEAVDAREMLKDNRNFSIVDAAQQERGSDEPQQLTEGQQVTDGDLKETARELEDQLRSEARTVERERQKVERQRIRDEITRSEIKRIDKVQGRSEDWAEHQRDRDRDRLAENEQPDEDGHDSSEAEPKEPPLPIDRDRDRLAENEQPDEDGHDSSEAEPKEPPLPIDRDRDGSAENKQPDEDGHDSSVTEQPKEPPLPIDRDRDGSAENKQPDEDGHDSSEAEPKEPPLPIDRDRDGSTENKQPDEDGHDSSVTEPKEPPLPIDRDRDRLAENKQPDEDGHDSSVAEPREPALPIDRDRDRLAENKQPDEDGHDSSVAEPREPALPIDREQGRDEEESDGSEGSTDRQPMAAEQRSGDSEDWERSDSSPRDNEEIGRALDSVPRPPDKGGLPDGAVRDLPLDDRAKKPDEEQDEPFEERPVNDRVRASVNQQADSGWKELESGDSGGRDKRGGGSDSSGDSGDSGDSVDNDDDEFDPSENMEDYDEGLEEEEVLVGDDGMTDYEFCEQILKENRRYHELTPDEQARFDRGLQEHKTFDKIQTPTDPEMLKSKNLMVETNISERNIGREQESVARQFLGKPVGKKSRHVF